MHDVTGNTGGMTVRMRALIGALALGASLAAPVAAMASGTGTALDRVNRLETGTSLLSQKLGGMSDSLSAFVPPGTIPVTSGAALDTAPILVAQSNRDPAALAVRLDQVEEQMRTLNGQVEGLQFQLTQLQTLLERMQQDTDARFSAVEGGVSPGKTNAASQSGGATPTLEAPQSMDLSAPAGTDAGFGTTTGTDPNDQPIDLGAPIELGAPERPLGTLSLDNLPTDSGPEISLGSDATRVTDADADAQYAAGYEAVIKGDYAFAEDQFRQFIALFPDHPQAPDATNWLGEALIQRGDYEEAANILLTGFQSYPNAARAPDILMKLGIALNGSGENDTACRTFGEVLKRYPDVSPAFKQRLAQEEKNARC